jgi:hypothetical protein
MRQVALFLLSLILAWQRSQPSNTKGSFCRRGTETSRLPYITLEKSGRLRRREILEV